MLIQLTDKWRSSPPIMTDPTLGVIRRPGSLEADLPEHLAQWAITHGYAIAPGTPGPSPEAPVPPAAPEPDPLIDLILEFVNGANEAEIEAVRGITAAAAEKLVSARPVTAESLETLLTAKQVQSLRQFVEGDAA